MLLSVILSNLLLLTCVHNDVFIYIYINIFSFVVEWFAKYRSRHADECSGYNSRIT